MALVQRDYILRLMEAIAAAIARIVQRRQAGDLLGARREAHVARVELLGSIASVVETVDSRTAGDLIGDPWRLSALARLVGEDAETLRLMNEERAAEVLERRACELLLEAWMRSGELDPESARTLDAFSARVPFESLGPRHREALAGWHGRNVRTA